MHDDQPTDESLRAEIQALHQQLAMYQGIVNNLPLGMVLYQLEKPDDHHSLRLIAVNPAASTQTGAVAEEWIGLLIDEVIPDSEQQGTAMTYLEAMRTNTPLSLEYIDYDENRQILRVTGLNAIPLPNDHLAVLFENITERRRAEMALRERETQIRTVLSHAPLILFAFDRSGIITVAEGRTLEQLGRSSSDLIGHSMEELYQQQPGLLSAMRRALAGSMTTAEAEIAGTLFEIRYTPVLDESGQIERVIGVGTDITARKQADEALRQSLAQEELINAQAAALRELSTPLIPLADEIVVMPLIGSLDSTRTQQVMETLLEGIVTHQASIAILDITGVPVVDTQVADALLRTARAVKLLGAQVVITGIASGVAQSLVHLGADLGDIVTLSNLQSGINYALEHR